MADAFLIPVNVSVHPANFLAGFFIFWGQIPPAPNFAEFHARGSRGRLAVMPRDLIPPWGGAYFSTVKRESRPRQSGLPCPKTVPRLGGRRQRARLLAGFSAAAGFSGRRAAHGRAQTGRKAAHTGASGAVRAGLPGGPPGSFRVRSGAFSGARRAKTGRRRGKTGRSGALRGRERRRWGQKNPFCRKKGGQRGCAGAKTGGVIGGACRVVCPCAGIFGRFRRKSWGFEKAFPRAYRKELPFVPFLCRWRTVSGGDSLVVRSGCFFARKE